MQSFTHHAATARIHTLGGGVSEIAYSGPMGHESLEKLRSLALAATAGASCLVLRMDRVLNTTHCLPPACREAYSGNTAPAAVIVREDQFEMWDVYARQAARQGIMRAVFLSAFADQAYRWARASAGAAALGSRQ